MLCIHVLIEFIICHVQIDEPAEQSQTSEGESQVLELDETKELRQELSTNLRLRGKRDGESGVHKTEPSVSREALSAPPGRRSSVFYKISSFLVIIFFIVLAGIWRYSGS